MKNIPLFVIEEHNESFLIWNYASLNNIIRPVGNTLLHVDYHPDMEYGGYRTGIRDLEDDLEAIKSFTYNCLGIADFIYPSVYQGIFNEIIFVKNTSNTLSNEVEKCLYSNDGCGKNIKLKQVNSLLRLVLKNQIDNEDTYAFFRYREGGLENLKLKQPFVLDIDIDYFSPDDSLSTVGDKLIEITKDAYDDFDNNLYHPFRILPRRLITHIEKNGKYYLRYEEQCEKNKEASSDTILRRLSKFGYYLENLNRKPDLIIICRSRFSGYTNNNNWRFIEEELIKLLNKMYDLEIKGVKDV